MQTNNNNIIFLDIDGVLNTENHLRRQQREKGKGSVTNRDWCPIACRHVTLLCNQFDARIVVSSTWRYEHGLDGVRQFFSANGIAEDLVIGITPTLIGEMGYGTYCRGDEISRWLKNIGNGNGTGTYVIIDDMPASGFLEEQKPYLVSVDPEKGFAAKEKALKAAEILGKIRDA